MAPEMLKHCPAVVRDKNPYITCGAVQNFRVAEIIQFGILD